MSAKLCGRQVGSLVLIRKWTVERVRAARAPLIDEDDVALALHTCKGRCDEGVEIGGSLSGPASENEKRVGGCAPVERCDNSDVEIDLARVRVIAVLRNLERSAARFYGLQMVRM